MTDEQPALTDLDILLVEDDPADVRMTQLAAKEALDLENIQVVKDGKEALDYLYKRGGYEDAGTPDLILLDLNMPGRDGFEILEEIKADPDLKVIPVIVLTTSTSEEDILRAYRAHANSYVVKPRSFSRWVDLVLGIREHWMGVAILPPHEGAR